MSEKKLLFDNKSKTDDEGKIKLPNLNDIEFILEVYDIPKNLNKSIDQKSLRDYYNEISDLKDVFFSAKNLTTNYKKLPVYKASTSHIKNFNQKLEESDINQTANELIYYTVLQQKLAAEEMLEYLNSIFKENNKK